MVYDLKTKKFEASLGKEVIQRAQLKRGQKLPDLFPMNVVYAAGRKTLKFILYHQAANEAEGQPEMFMVVINDIRFDQHLFKTPFRGKWC